MVTIHLRWACENLFREQNAANAVLLTFGAAVAEATRRGERRDLKKDPVVCDQLIKNLIASLFPTSSGCERSPACKWKIGSDNFPAEYLKFDHRRQYKKYCMGRKG